MTEQQELDEILKEVREASWSMGLQNAPLDQLHNPRNNKRATDKAKQALLDWHNKQVAKARIEEVEMFSAGVAPGKYMAPHWYAEDRIAELSQTLKEHKER